MKLKKILIFFLCFFGIQLIIVYYNSKKDYEKSYDFIIAKISITQKKRMIFYSDETKFPKSNFTSSVFTIMETEDVKIGDKVFKEAGARKLFILRKNKNGVYEVHKIYYPTGLF
jgi:hypothetical protein